MIYTVRSSHPGVDFGNVQTATFTTGAALSGFINRIAGLGFYVEVSTEPHVCEWVPPQSVVLDLEV